MKLHLTIAVAVSSIIIAILYSITSISPILATCIMTLATLNIYSLLMYIQYLENENFVMSRMKKIADSTDSLKKYINSIKNN